MVKRRWILVGGVLVGLGSLGCGHVSAPFVAGTEWQIDVASVSRTAFTVRVSLNGEIVYADPTPKIEHSTRVVRGYQPGPNIIEADIISAVDSPSIYVMTANLMASSDGKPIAGSNLAPTSLNAGQRLSMTLYVVPAR